MNNSDEHTPIETQTTEKPGELMFSLLHAAQTLQDRMEQAFDAVGLSSAKYGVLAELAEAGESLPLSELAARVSCVRSNMTQLVDRLEVDGLVRRTNDPSDRRVIRAELTSLGEEKARAGAQQMADVQSAFSASLSQADQERLASVLSALF